MLTCAEKTKERRRCFHGRLGMMDGNDGRGGGSSTPVQAKSAKKGTPESERQLRVDCGSLVCVLWACFVLRFLGVVTPATGQLRLTDTEWQLLVVKM